MYIYIPNIYIYTIYLYLYLYLYLYTHIDIYINKCISRSIYVSISGGRAERDLQGCGECPPICFIVLHCARFFCFLYLYICIYTSSQMRAQSRICELQSRIVHQMISSTCGKPYDVECAIAGDCQLQQYQQH